MLTDRKNVRDVKILPVFGRLEIDQGGKEQDHVPSLVHDGGAAVRTADLARQLVHARLLTAFVPAEVVVTVGEVDVVLVEDRGPLERGACIARSASTSAQH